GNRFSEKIMIQRQFRARWRFEEKSSRSKSISGKSLPVDTGFSERQCDRPELSRRRAIARRGGTDKAPAPRRLSHNRGGTSRLRRQAAFSGTSVTSGCSRLSGNASASSASPLRRGRSAQCSAL